MKYKAKEIDLSAGDLFDLLHIQTARGMGAVRMLQSKVDPPTLALLSEILHEIIGITSVAVESRIGRPGNERQTITLRPTMKGNIAWTLQQKPTEGPHRHPKPGCQARTSA